MVEFDETKHIHRKVCKHCGNDFWYRKNPYECVICKGIKRMKRYEKNREEEQGYARRWHQNNPEKSAEIRRRFNEKNPDYHKVWQQENSDKTAEYSAKYRNENRPELRRKAREYKRAKRAEDKVAQADEE